MSVLSVRKLTEDATVPVFDEEQQYILYAAEDMELIKNQPSAIKTGISVAFPKNYCAFIVGNGTCKCIGGLIDSDFRGEISVITINPTNISIKKGAAIARMAVIEIGHPEIYNDDKMDDESNAINVFEN